MKHPINDIVDESCKYVCEIMNRIPGHSINIREKREERRKKKEGRQVEEE